MIAPLLQSSIAAYFYYRATVIEATAQLLYDPETSDCERWNGRNGDGGAAGRPSMELNGLGRRQRRAHKRAASGTLADISNNNNGSGTSVSSLSSWTGDLPLKPRRSSSNTDLRSLALFVWNLCQPLMLMRPMIGRGPAVPKPCFAVSGCAGNILPDAVRSFLTLLYT